MTAWLANSSASASWSCRTRRGRRAGRFGCPRWCSWAWAALLARYRPQRSGAGDPRRRVRRGLARAGGAVRSRHRYRCALWAGKRPRYHAPRLSQRRAATATARLAPATAGGQPQSRPDPRRARRPTVPAARSTRGPLDRRPALSARRGAALWRWPCSCGIRCRCSSWRSRRSWSACCCGGRRSGWRGDSASRRGGGCRRVLVAVIAFFVLLGLFAAPDHRAGRKPRRPVPAGPSQAAGGQPADILLGPSRARRRTPPIPPAAPAPGLLAATSQPAPAQSQPAGQRVDACCAE